MYGGSVVEAGADRGGVRAAGAPVHARPVRGPAAPRRARAAARLRDDRRPRARAGRPAAPAARSPTAARWVVDACRAALPPAVDGRRRARGALHPRRDALRRAAKAEARRGDRVRAAAAALDRSQALPAAARALLGAARRVVTALRGVELRRCAAGRSLGHRRRIGLGQVDAGAPRDGARGAERRPRALSGRDLHALDARRAAARAARLPDGVPGPVRLARSAPAVGRIVAEPLARGRCGARPSSASASPRRSKRSACAPADAAKYPHEFSRRPAPAHRDRPRA